MSLLSNNKVANECWFIRADTTERASQLSADVSFVITRHERHIAAQRCHGSGTKACWYWQLVHVIINVIIISSSIITRGSDFVSGLHLMTTCCSHASLFSRPCACKITTHSKLTVCSRRTAGNQRPFQKISCNPFAVLSKNEEVLEKPEEASSSRKTMLEVHDFEKKRTRILSNS